MSVGFSIYTMFDARCAAPATPPHFHSFFNAIFCLFRFCSCWATFYYISHPHFYSLVHVLWQNVTSFSAPLSSADSEPRARCQNEIIAMSVATGPALYRTSPFFLSLTVYDLIMQSQDGNHGDVQYIIVYPAKNNCAGDSGPAHSPQNQEKKREHKVES